MDLDSITYRILVRDAFIYNMKQTEEGKEYLEQCWIITQTKPDRKSLRDQFGR